METQADSSSSYLMNSAVAMILTMILVRYAAKRIQSTCNCKERKYTKQFQRYKRKYERKMRGLKHAPEQERKQVESEYHSNLKDLLTKTRDPKLFADIVRENMPMDATCVAACLPVLQRGMENRGIDVKRLILVVNASGVADVFSDRSGDEEGAAIKIFLVNGHFQASSNDTSNSGTSYGSNNCLYDALCQLKPYLKCMTADEFREEIAKEIETSSIIRDRLSYGWHQHKIAAGQIGGGKLKHQDKKRKVSTKKQNAKVEERSEWKFNKEVDVDLTEDRMMNNEEIQEQLKAALHTALGKCNEMLRKYTDVNRRFVSLSFKDFKPVLWDQIRFDDPFDGKISYFPVQIEIEIQAFVREMKNQMRTIKIEIDIDNPCVYERENGPKVPHVGYNVAGPSLRKTGHILINKADFIPHRNPANKERRIRGTIPPNDQRVPVSKMFSRLTDHDVFSQYATHRIRHEW